MKWAQRKDRVFITIELADFENQKIELTPEGQLKFQADSHNNVYAFDLGLFDQVDVEQSKWNTKGRNIILNISKKNTDTDHWPRLTKEKTKNAHIQIDWSKWVDEDEEDEAKPVGDDFDGDNMNNFNMGGYGEGDSDDEEEEEETKENQEHVHGENCNHDHDHGHDHEHHAHTEDKKTGADLGDLDADVEEPPK
ncbi:UNKNOWN [Stylonychia lemnae]|uniref:CS domain-containing protein n=1 Tax=Stylonychia lemnae TaxID=5949 RepID=A0A078B7L3_STYLE|nr:UNKNOWN [Stylonychia lemnae]|eukprot:CDW90495.1 UNKNOWN [Stylonychia lemnae]